MKVLVAEDDVVYRRILEGNLAKWSYQVVSATDGVEAWDVLRGTDAPRLALLNWGLPGLDGIEICRRLRKTSNEPYTYIVLVTARNLEHDMLAGFDAGADDYITKPFHPMELKARLRAGERILALQADLMHARDALQYQANHDTLTQLENRLAVMDRLRQELTRSARQKYPLSVALIDIDRFKAVNDTHGHAAGDAVLFEVARRMSTAVRSYDCVGRYGGEEFIALFPDCGQADALPLAERLAANIRNTPIQYNEVSLGITVSIGIAVAEPPHDRNAEELIRRADFALYEAKHRGRNRVILAEPLQY